MAYQDLAPNRATIQPAMEIVSARLETTVRFWQRTLTELAILIGLTVFPIATPIKGAMPEKKLEELRAKREPLFRRFANNPNEVHLALEIKFIDDQIAECKHHIELKKKGDLALRGK